jgi:DNA end-binding protein Ku
MRSIWDGTISVGGLFNVGVKLYKSTEDGNGVHFRQLCNTCGSPIRQPKWCDNCQKEVPFGDLLKGYEIAKGEFVKMTKQQVDELKPENFQRVDILKCISFEELCRKMERKSDSYFTAPNKSDAAYCLLREILKSTGKVAIGKIVLRDREHLCAVAPDGDGKRLVIHTIHFNDEMRNPEGLKAPVEVAPKERELEIGKMIISQLSENDVNLDEIREEYTAKIQQLIEDMRNGKPMPTVAELQQTTSSDLGDALEMTLKLLKDKSPRVAALKAEA